MLQVASASNAIDILHRLRQRSHDHFRYIFFSQRHEQGGHALERRIDATVSVYLIEKSVSGFSAEILRNAGQRSSRHQRRECISAEENSVGSFRK